jgi:signal transduction histidine kinase
MARLVLTLNKVAGRLSNLLGKAANDNKLLQVTLLLIIVSPVLLIAVFAYMGAHRDLTQSTLARRQSIAYLAAAALEERFNRLTDIALSLATRVRFRQLVAEEKWDEAIEILRDVRVNFPFIDRVFLADPAGTLMADAPALPGVRGKNFAIRDWYQGVSANWQPYISDVYQRAAEPRFNVVAAAIPIKAEEEKIVGILVLQVQLNEMVGWSKLIGIGQSGFVYFVDKKGQLATHPKLPSQGQLLDLLKIPVVQKVLRGQAGVELIFNSLENDEQIAAYAPLSRIGWGVIASESALAAFQQRDHTLRWLLILYGFIFLLSCAFAYVILRTVTGLKQAEKKILRLNEDLQHKAHELEGINKELEAFSYSVSHDLRAPLRAIDGFSQALLEDCSERLDREGQEYLDRIRAGSQRMGELIDDLLNLSRVSRTAITRESVNLSALAHSIATELQETEPGRRVEVAIAEKLTADGDQRLLRVALQNLLGNSWKFTGRCAEPKVEFGIAQNNGRTAYFVRDNGAGFDMSYADKLFGPFQRLHAMTEFKGTGIGLATVQRIVRRHGGHVWAEAQVGHGATFYFTLN